MGFGALGEIVDVLRGGDLEREAFAFDAVRSFGAIVLRDEDHHAAGLEGNRDQLSVAVMLAIDGEAEDIAIPISASLEIVDRKRGLECEALECATRHSHHATSGDG